MKKKTIILAIVLCLIPIVLPVILFVVLALIWGIAVAISPPNYTSTLTKTDTAPTYETVDDFYRLTGVEFPEIVPVDSLFYDEGCLRANIWSEHKFVAPHKLPRSFYRRLDAACKNDPGHWTKEAGRFTDWAYRCLGMQVDTSAVTYRYWVYPSGSEKVDRNHPK